jgi:hypothetical protein
MNHLFAKALAFRDALWLIGELSPLYIAGIITITLFTAWLGAITLAVDGNLLGLIAAVYECVVNEKVFLGEGASWQNPLRLADLILWRLPTSWWRRVPDVFILGAQKAGTTSLHHYMVGTSDEAYDGDDLTRTYPFGGAMVKETHFLDGRSPYGTMGEASDSLRRRLLASFFPLLDLLDHARPELPHTEHRTLAAARLAAVPGLLQLVRIDGVAAAARHDDLARQREAALFTTVEVYERRPQLVDHRLAFLGAGLLLLAPAAAAAEERGEHVVPPPAATSLCLLLYCLKPALIVHRALLLVGKDLVRHLRHLELLLITAAIGVLLNELPLPRLADLRLRRGLLNPKLVVHLLRISRWT